MSTQAKPIAAKVDHGETSQPLIPYDQLYAAAEEAATIPHFEDIDDQAVQQYHEQGYLVIEQAFDANEVARYKQAILDLIDGCNPDFENIQFEAWAAKQLENLTIEQKQDAVRKLMWFSDADECLAEFVAHPKLMAAVTRLLGQAPKALQEMALLKPPRGREKPWHQDCAYFDIPLGTPVVGTWTALDDATVTNGCLHVVAGSHKQGAIVHFKRRDWQICDTDLPGHRQIATPVPAGGCVLFDGMLMHGTPPNKTDQRRRALQIHYLPQNVATEGEHKARAEKQRLEAFGSEGKDVEC